MSEKMQYLKSGIFSYSGKLVTILSSFVYIFLIANYFEPADYGLVNYYISFTLGLIGIFGVSFFGGLLSVFMPKWKSRKFFGYILYVVLVLSGILFVSVILFSKDISVFLGKGNNALLQITSILLLIMPFILIYTALFRSFKLFGKELKFNSIVAVLNLLFAFSLVVVLNYGVFGVVYAMALANLVGLVFLFFHSRHLKYINTSIDFSALKMYSKFGIPATVLHRIDGQVLLIFMGLFVANNELGMYYIAFKIASIMLSMPVASLTEVLLPYLSESSTDKRKMSRYVSLNIKFTLILTIILSFFIIACSKPFLALFFPKYVNAYSLIVLFIPLFIVSSLSPITNLFLSLNRMDVIAKSHFGGLMCTVVFGLILMPYFGVFGLILTQTLDVLVSRGILVYYLKSVDLKVDIVPKRRDIVYFLDSLRDMFIARFKKRI